MRNMLPIVTVKQIARRFGEVSEFVASGVEGDPAPDRRSYSGVRWLKLFHKLLFVGQ